MSNFFSLKRKQSNVFVSILEALQVKHTDSFSNAYYRQHLHKNNLCGLSKMLFDYGVENEGLRINNKLGYLFELEVPFIAKVSNDFVAVLQVDQRQVSYIWKGEKRTIETGAFFELWSGVVLLVEADELSEEPDYKLHHKQKIKKN